MYLLYQRKPELKCWHNNTADGGWIIVFFSAVCSQVFIYTLTKRINTWYIGSIAAKSLTSQQWGEWKACKVNWFNTEVFWQVLGSTTALVKKV